MVAAGKSIMLPFVHTFRCSAHSNHTLKEEHVFKQDFFKMRKTWESETLKGLPGPPPA